MDAFAEKLLTWFRYNARDLPWRREPTPYRVWVSEIMLQQTRVEAVKEYYLHFLRELPSVEALAAVPGERLMKLWEGLGYYSRARNLQKAAKMIVAQGAFPNTPESIAALPGIGTYTAGAISSIAFGLPEPAVDGNVLRVLSRLLGKNVEKVSAAAWLRPRFPEGKCSAFTQGWMEIGATVCLPNGDPRCEVCPFRGDCVARKEGRIAELPVKAEKRPRKIVRKTVFLLTDGTRFALLKRQEKGVLSGLWGLPETEEVLSDEAAVRKYWEARGTAVRICRALGRSKHVFTHLEWHMENYLVEAAAIPEEFTAAAPEEIAMDFALPSAYRFAVGKMGVPRR